MFTRSLPPPTATYNLNVKSLYEKTIAFVLQYIDERKLEVGAQLPTEMQISSLAGVSLVTVRRARASMRRPPRSAACILACISTRRRSCTRGS